MEVIIAVQYSFTSVMKAAGKGLEEISIVFDSAVLITWSGPSPTRGVRG